MYLEQMLNLQSIKWLPFGLGKRDLTFVRPVYLTNHKVQASADWVSAKFFLLQTEADLISS